MWVCITADDSVSPLTSVQVHESKQVHHDDGMRLVAGDHCVDHFLMIYHSSYTLLFSSQGSACTHIYVLLFAAGGT